MSTGYQTKRPRAARSRQSILRRILIPANGAAFKTGCCVGRNVEMILFPVAIVVGGLATAKTVNRVSIISGSGSKGQAQPEQILILPKIQAYR